jgi:hypothetical protein
MKLINRTVAADCLPADAYICFILTISCDKKGQGVPIRVPRRILTNSLVRGILQDEPARLTLICIRVRYADETDGTLGRIDSALHCKQKQRDAIPVSSRMGTVEPERKGGG